MKNTMNLSSGFIQQSF